jgi:hypothetical protein
VVATRETLVRLSQFAEDQWGLVTRRQAEGAGLSKATMTRLVGRGDLERVAHGVYRLRGAPTPDHVELRAAWLQLAPELPAWERTADDGVVSHRSAAEMYGLGHLPADVHEFTVPSRRQTRRDDVRLHIRPLRDGEWISLRGLPVTRPSRIVSDLLLDGEDPSAIAQLVADAIRPIFDYPGTFADALAPFAARFGLRRGDGLALLRWLLDLVGDPQTEVWMNEARAHITGRLENAEEQRRAAATGRTGPRR